MRRGQVKVPFSVKTFLLMKGRAGIEKCCLINFSWERSCADGFSVFAEDMDVALLRTVTDGRKSFHLAIKGRGEILLVG